MTLGEPLGPVLCVVGARPNYMKMAPIMRACSADRRIPGTFLVHTGQHYDESMNQQLFRDLQLPAPDLNLSVGSGSHALQTAEVMRRFEPVLDDVKPSCVMVVGDVNSTLACALVATKKHVPVVHVEAGLRSFDRRMPEEVNRVLTDQISDLLFTTERSAHDNLAREGIEAGRVHFVGNVMIDSLHAHLNSATPVRETLEAAGIGDGFLGEGGYAVVTLHRPSNVDEPAVLSSLLHSLEAISRTLPLIWPVHPRTRASIQRFGLESLLQSMQVALLPPQGYLQMLGLMRDATVVLTDSGGIQEETTALGVPCLTLRDSTERPITVEEGTNTVVGADPDAIRESVGRILAGEGKRGRSPELWDGRASQRIAQQLAHWLGASRARIAA
jgi:UDP-N-acetylglucosamine 2-epimerase (non-hydrolysing)